MTVRITHSKTLSAPDSGAEDKVYGVDYVSTGSHTLTGYSTVCMSTFRSTSTIATAGIAELLFAVSSAVKYRFEFGVVFATSISTTGIKLGLLAPATSSFAAVVRIPQGVGVARTLGEIVVDVSSSGGFASTSTAAFASTKYFAEITGAIVPSSDGNLQVMWGSEIAGSAVSTFVGSYGALTTL